jgi:hypothetical protein
LDDDLTPFGPGDVLRDTVEADARSPSNSNRLSDEVGLALEPEE